MPNPACSTRRLCSDCDRLIAPGLRQCADCLRRRAGENVRIETELDRARQHARAVRAGTAQPDWVDRELGRGLAR